MKRERIPVITINSNERRLKEAKIYVERDEEVIPHFNLVLKDGSTFKIMLEKAEYIEPIPRKLTDDELLVLIKYLKETKELYDLTPLVCGKNFWHECICLWNHDNVGYKEYYKDGKLPNYQKIINDDNINMPQYTKLNEKDYKLKPNKTNKTVYKIKRYFSKIYQNYIYVNGKDLILEIEITKIGEIKNIERVIKHTAKICKLNKNIKNVIVDFHKQSIKYVYEIYNKEFYKIWIYKGKEIKI